MVSKTRAEQYDEVNDHIYQMVIDSTGSDDRMPLLMLYYMFERLGDLIVVLEQKV